MIRIRLYSETLIINIPEHKSEIVKQILKEFGVIIQKDTLIKRPSDFAGSISKERANELLLKITHGRTEWERNT
jgi:hypothetical protein